ncbi:MAG TPA: acyl-CoA dehydrogenase family protein [Rubrivivax sp.]|nr:acyl-CoA dehydrogenase family protein [Rubrivivax sp.]
MNTALESCLRAATEVPARDSVAGWWPRWRDGAARAPAPAAQALLGGFDADRVGWAFASGYQAALRALLPGLPPDAVAAFCVTEESGNRPRDIRTRLRPAAGGGWLLDGAKRWTTLGPDSSVLLVVAALPADDAAQRPQLKVARVPAGAPGLQLLAMPETRFVPEVPHARVQLDGVALDDAALLPGDGYERYVKPFRTIEDIHVTLAVLAYLLREARQRRWPAGFAERLCALLVTLAALSAAAADAPAAHVALAGALALAHALYDEAGTLWALTPGDPAAQRWQRDAALFAVAGSARSQRSARAWQRLQA